MLKEIRSGNQDADITILIANGFHRPTTLEEMYSKYGRDIVEKEKLLYTNQQTQKTWSWQELFLREAGVN
jgi:nickel-dependent lactate racemase